MSPPERLGRYVIEAELGRGAMGRVYRGHDPAIDRLVALKTIHLPEGLSDKERREAIERFSREARAAGKLSHPNIVTVYDTGTDPVAGAFIAMEHVLGTSLDGFVRPGHLLDRPRAVHILAQAAEALAYAHSQGVVHRDIKPANLLLVDGRTVKIADFGLAKTAGASVTQDGALLGSPNYMSPEQIRGQTLDGRSDLFSLGVVAYEMLTGRLPFGGASISTVIYRILSEHAAEPGLGTDPESVKLRAVLGRALAKRPEDRFATGSEFAAALNEAVPAAVGVSSPGRLPMPATPSHSDNTPTIVSGSGLAGAPARGGVVRAPARRPAVAPALAHPRRSSRMLVAGGVFLAAVAVGIVVLLGLGRGVGERVGAATPAVDVSAPVGAAAGPGGSIVLLSNPPGAEYFVDGVKLTEARLTAPEEGQIIEVTARAGCMEGSRRIERADAGDTIVMALQPAEVLAQVTSNPAGASVAVDGERKGAAPLSLKLDGCKEHRIDLTLAGHRPARRDLELDGNRLSVPGPIEVQMAPILPGLMIAPKAPFPVEMTIDGGRRVEPGARLSLTPGSHKLRLASRDLLYEAVLDVEVAEGAEVTPRPNFPAVARLTVRTQPGNATLSVERGDLKRDLGAPPIFGEQVVAGTYIVRCTFLHNGETQERRVNLGAGENPALVFVAGRPAGSESP